MKKKIIILGSTGFIGRNLIEYFSKKKITQFLVLLIKKNLIN